MGHHEHGVDLAGLERPDHRADFLERPDADVLDREAEFFRRDGAHVMEGGADLGHRQRLALQLRRLREPGLIGLLGRQEGHAVDILALVQHAADGLDRALAGKVDETAGDARDGEIRVARGHRNRGRRGGLEEPEFDVQAFLLEIAPFEGDEAGAVRGEAQGADHQLVGGDRRLCNSRCCNDRGGGAEKRAARVEAMAHRHGVSLPSD